MVANYQPPRVTPWLPDWLAFLSGLPEPARKRRTLVPYQVFIDESGGRGATRTLVLAGLVSSAKDWALFSDEWRACLDALPSVPSFKMKDAASCGGHFYKWNVAVRNRKIAELAKIINRHVELAICMAVDIEAHAEYVADIPQKPFNAPYSFLLHNMLLASCYSLWDAGLRERFEIIFDENYHFGPATKSWYPLMRRIQEIDEPESSAIMPTDLIFRSDDEFMPLQAADMFAWCWRNAEDNLPNREWEWILRYMPNVVCSRYSRHFNRQEMSRMSDLSYKMLERGDIPKEIFEEARQIRKSIRRS